MQYEIHPVPDNYQTRMLPDDCNPALEFLVDAVNQQLAPSNASQPVEHRHVVSINPNYTSTSKGPYSHQTSLKQWLKASRGQDHPNPGDLVINHDDHTIHFLQRNNPAAFSIVPDPEEIEFWSADYVGHPPDEFEEVFKHTLTEVHQRTVNSRRGGDQRCLEILSDHRSKLTIHPENQEPETETENQQQNRLIQHSPALADLLAATADGQTTTSLWRNQPLYIDEAQGFIATLQEVLAGWKPPDSPYADHADTIAKVDRQYLSDQLDNNYPELTETQLDAVLEELRNLWHGNHIWDTIDDLITEAAANTLGDPADGAPDPDDPAVT